MAAGQDETAATFRDVFVVGEFRALWTAQTLSVIGDQLARVALTLLVYDRTGSPLLAAITFAASIVPIFVGGIVLAGLADRFSRRRVMIVCDLLRLVLVLAMIVPDQPIAVLVALLFALTMLGPPFTSARTGIYADVLAGDKYVVGMAVTLTTFQLAQVLGFALGGAVVALVGVRAALLADAATYAVSALITWVWVRARPAARGAPGGRQHLAGIGAGLRLAFRLPGLRIPMLFGWLTAFYNVPEGVAAPLASSLGGGAGYTGFILAAGALGAAVGAIVFTRFTGPDTRLRWTRPLAIAACGTLALFALGPGFAITLVILFCSGLFDCYQVGASSAFVQAAPPEHRSQVFGIAQAGMSLGQGLAMVLAGAAAGAHAPSTVIAVSGVLGALVAATIPASGIAGRSPADRPGGVSLPRPLRRYRRVGAHARGRSAAPVRGPQAESPSADAQGG